MILSCRISFIIIIYYLGDHLVTPAPTAIGDTTIKIPSNRKSIIVINRKTIK